MMSPGLQADSWFTTEMHQEYNYNFLFPQSLKCRLYVLLTCFDFNIDMLVPSYLSY